MQIGKPSMHVPWRCRPCVPARWRVHSWWWPVRSEYAQRSPAAEAPGLPDWSLWHPKRSAASCVLKPPKGNGWLTNYNLNQMAPFFSKWAAPGREQAAVLSDFPLPLETVPKCRKPLTDLLSSSMPVSPSATDTMNAFTSVRLAGHHEELWVLVLPACNVCGWSSRRRLSSLCVCERWRFSEVTLSSMAVVFISQDIWDRAAISFSVGHKYGVNQRH